MNSADPALDCLDVLLTASPAEKARVAGEAAARVLAERAASGVRHNWRFDPPPRPARPDTPVLKPPGGVPRRRLGSPEGRVALLHALAHIEFNAIDLAFDMALRFSGEIAAAGLDAAAFFSDWVAVGGDEARHYLMLADRLEALGSRYGALPAHDGLWEAAIATADDALARLAIAPLVLEARGLDVTPGMIDGLERAGDSDSAEILKIIYRDEIGHVAAGARWFRALCAARRVEPAEAFRALVAARFAGKLKPPFNHAARGAAGLEPSFYGSDLAGDSASGRTGTDFAEHLSATGQNRRRPGRKDGDFIT